MQRNAIKTKELDEEEMTIKIKLRIRLMNIMILKFYAVVRCMSQVSELPSSQRKERNMNQIFRRSPDYLVLKTEDSLL